MSKLFDTIGGFVTIPNTVIKMIPLMGPEAFTLWSYLRYRTNGESGVAFPSYQLIKEDTGLIFRKTAAALRMLESLDLLSRHKRFGNSSEYTLKCPVLPPQAGKSCQRGQTNKTDVIETDSLSTTEQELVSVANSAPSTVDDFVPMFQPAPPINNDFLGIPIGEETEDPFAGALGAPAAPPSQPKLDNDTRRMVIKAISQAEMRDAKIPADILKDFTKDWAEEAAPIIARMFGFAAPTSDCYTVARMLLKKNRPKLGEAKVPFYDILLALEHLRDSIEARKWKNNNKVSPYMVPRWIENYLALTPETASNGNFLIFT